MKRNSLIIIFLLIFLVSCSGVPSTSQDPISSPTQPTLSTPTSSPEVIMDRPPKPSDYCSAKNKVSTLSIDLPDPFLYLPFQENISGESARQWIIDQPNYIQNGKIATL